MICSSVRPVHCQSCATMLGGVTHHKGYCPQRQTWMVAWTLLEQVRGLESSKRWIRASSHKKLTTAKLLFWSGLFFRNVKDHLSPSSIGEEQRNEWRGEEMAQKSFGKSVSGYSKAVYPSSSARCSSTCAKLVLQVCGGVVGWGWRSECGGLEV